MNLGVLGSVEKILNMNKKVFNFILAIETKKLCLVNVHDTQK